MTASTGSVRTISSAWEVLTLFLIPVGGGIPAGVLLARSRNISWPLTMILYFISDVVLACLFEPVMRLVIAAGKRFPFFARLGEAFGKSMKKTASYYGAGLGPLSLILVAFGADPMTGRTVAVAAGHGFLSGWALAITGDMLYFVVLMVSTLWLNELLGDGTRTTVIILVGMMVVPVLVRRLRERMRTGRVVSPPRDRS